MRTVVLLALLCPSLATIGGCGGTKRPVQQVTAGETDPSTEASSAVELRRESLGANPRDDGPGAPRLHTEKPAEPAFPFKLGTYVQSHGAFTECEQIDPCEIEVQDVLTLAAGADGALNVAIAVTQDNGHSCNFTGHLAEIAPDYWGWADETQQCRVELRFDAPSLIFTSDGCREVYCGARASLLGTFDLGGLQVDVAP